MESKQIKRILVTGAFGLVGSNICKVLERDYPEIEITKVKYNEFTNWDFFIKYDYIIHGAGYGQPQKFSQDKLSPLQINTSGTMLLLDMLEKDGKFLFISTSEVYSGAPSPHKETDIGTTTPQHPRACYIEGKRCGEAICMVYKEEGYDVKIARLALAYGPGTKKGDTRVINQFIEQALTTGKINLLDDGTAVRTYCYVDDAVEQMLNILFKGKDVVYNVGGKSTWSIINLAVQIGNLLGVEVKEGSAPLNGAPRDVRLDMTKTLTEFPMELIPLEEGLKRTIEYQKELYGIN